MLGEILDAFTLSDLIAMFVIGIPTIMFLLLIIDHWMYHE